MTKKTELKHFGVLGMKWGVHKRIDETRFRKPNQKGDTEKGSWNPLKKRKEKLVQKYLNKGFGKEAAENAAKQRLRAEALVAGVATVAVAIVATKSAVYLGQEYVDKVIKSGTEIQNINANNSTDFSKIPFFAAINKHDKKAYASLYPYEKRMMMQNLGQYNGIYKNRINVTESIKRASVKNARDVFYKMMDEDKVFKQKVLDTMQKTNYKSGIKKYMDTGQLNKKLYDSFNQALATPEFQSNKIHTKFYDELKKKGYGAILDINDKRYSGYSKISKSPTIFFDDHLKKIESIKISDADIDKNNAKYIQGYLLKNGAKQIAGIAGGYGLYKEITNTRKVDKYLKEHPDSKLSRKEILKVVNRK